MGAKMVGTVSRSRFRDLPGGRKEHENWRESSRSFEIVVGGMHDILGLRGKIYIVFQIGLNGAKNGKFERYLR